jgi:photosystem II stability/assembly factor-like uncharacterized protein
MDMGRHFGPQQTCIARLLPLLVILCALLPRPDASIGREVSNFAAPRLDAWHILGPGGGGAQFTPTISPIDPNLVLVSCDMTGSYISTDGGDSWRMFNLRGVTRFFVADPVDANIIYAANQGLYRSGNKGKTWELLYPKPDQVDRIVKSDDHAGEKIILRDGSQTGIDALAVDPADSNVSFSVFSREKVASLFQTRDGAKTWQDLGPLPAGGRKIFIDPASPKKKRTLYVAGSNSVSVLENGRWTHGKAPDGVRRFLDVAAGFPAAGGKPIFYAISGINWRGGDTGATGLFISSDAGSTWRTIPLDFLFGAPAESARVELRAVATCLTQPNVAYLSFRDHTKSLPPAERSLGVARTDDLGKTWRLVWKDTGSKPADNVQDPWITARYGPGWGENPFALAVSVSNPDLCFGTDFGRTMRTRDGGKTWQGVYSRRLEDGTISTTGLDVLTCYGVHFDPFDLKHWFVGFADIGLFESRNGGRSWMEATSRGMPREWSNTSYWSIFDPEVKGRIWSAMSGVHDLPRPKMWEKGGVANYRGGIVYSDDGGKTWRPSSEGMGQTAATHILMDPKSPINARTLYVCGFGKGVLKSTDGGRSWVLKNNGLEGAEPFAWRLVSDSMSRLYLLVARRSDDGSIGSPMDGALYRSADGAEHWEKLNLPAGCNAPNGLAVDPADDSRIYLAAWGRSTPDKDSGGGLYVSSDAGKTWKNTLDKDQHLFDVTLDGHAPGVLYAVGFESSIWKSADRGESWTRLRGFNFKWGHRVLSDPLDPAKIFVATFGGCIWHGPSNGDATAVEDIVTPLR